MMGTCRTPTAAVLLSVDGENEVLDAFPFVHSLFFIFVVIAGKKYR